MPKVYAMIVDNDVPTIKPIDTENLGTANIGGVTYWLVPATTAAETATARPTSSVSAAAGERHGAR
jgi:hypothetical protein